MITNYKTIILYSTLSRPKLINYPNRRLVSFKKFKTCASCSELK